WFNLAVDNHEAIDEYSTTSYADSNAATKKCSQNSWSSKKISTVIQRFPNNGYHTMVSQQRCKSCKKLGALQLDKNSYGERITYRLKKWAFALRSLNTMGKPVGRRMSIYL
ncbi:hypothetical protein N657DRAFT_575905, partial [Parathielavia appendiculata]